MNTTTLTLTKDQLNIAIAAVRDTLNWYRFSSQDADHSPALRAHYAQKADECLALEEIISGARKELIRSEMK